MTGSLLSTWVLRVVMPCDKHTSFITNRHENPCISSRNRNIPKTQNGTVVLGREFFKLTQFRKKWFEQSFSFPPPKKKTAEWFLALFGEGWGDVEKTWSWPKNDQVTSRSMLVSEDSAPWQYLRHWRRKFEGDRVRYAATQGDERQRGSRNAGGRGAGVHGPKNRTKTRWWFQIFVIFTPNVWGRWTHFDEHIFQMGCFKYVFVFTPIWGNDPIWLICFRWVETTS